LLSHLPHFFNEIMLPQQQTGQLKIAEV